MTGKKTVKKGAVIGLALLSGAAFAGGVYTAPLKAHASPNVYYTIDAASTLQTMEGWGTSLCWWANAVGGWDMEGVSGQEKRQEIVDLVFGEDGLNLNIARYNIPGGDDPTHTHMRDYRGMSLVKASADADYQWENDANQMWILKSAYDTRDSDLYVEAFNNSAPYWMTESGCSSGSINASDANLPQENYGAYATYFADFVTYLEDELGVPISSMEVMNEANSDYWRANGTQEGCKVPAGEAQSELIKAVYQEMSERGLLDDGDIFAAPDETNPQMAYQSYLALDDEAKGIISKLNYHIYQNDNTSRKNLRDVAYGENLNFDDPNYRLWQSEITYGADDPHDHNSMDYSFVMAHNIHDDLYYGNVSAWIIWQAVETELNNLETGNNYGLIHGVYQDVDNSEYGFDMEHMALNRGDYYITKQYYTMGQYSRYIKPGYRIIQTPCSPAGEAVASGAGSGMENCVVALSPEKDEMVIVYSNPSDEDKELSFYLKGFSGTSAQKIMTNAEVNWQESEQSVNGEYLNFTADAGSIVTVVVKGGEVAAENTSESGIWFNSFELRSDALLAQFHLGDTSAEYTFWYASSADMLPVNGGTGATEVPVSVTGQDVTLSIPVEENKPYFGVLARSVNGQTYYSSVLTTRTPQTDNVFTYLTLAGYTDIYNISDTGFAFGANYGVADQAFGADPFTGKRWGYVETDAGAYNSEQLLTHARYANSSDTLTYKYEVEEGKTYSVMLAFLDPWAVAGRSMDLYINEEYIDTVSDTVQLTSLYAEHIEGIRESQSCFITVELRMTDGTSQRPAVNVIAVQEESPAREAALFSVMPIDDQVIRQGELVSDHIPPVRLLTSMGVTATEDFTIDHIDYTSALAQGGGSIKVVGTACGVLPFEFSIATQDPGEDTYYYIDAGGMTVNAGVQAIFEALQVTNPTLINRDAVDKYAQGEDDWGRLNNPAEIGEYYADGNYSAIESVFEVKEAKNVNGENRKSIDYRLTDLPAGVYTFEIGVNVWSWGSNRRDMYFSVWENGTETVLGMQSGYNGANVWSYRYEKTSGAEVPVVFSAYTKGDDPANPVLAYLNVKQVTRQTDLEGNALRAGTPTLPSNISATQKELTVGGLESTGALIVLTDETGNLLAERKVSAAEAAVGSVTFTGLDLSEVGTLRAQQFVEGKLPSSNTEMPISSFELTAPRLEWSAEADVISVLPSGNNIDRIEYRDGTNGDWIDIKGSKFFCATHNGDYYVRMTTTSGFEIINVVTVSKVDTLSMQVQTDLTMWTDSDMNLMLDFSGSARSMQSVVVADGTEQTDITSTGVNGVYSYTATHNGTYIVTAVSEGGTRRTFTVEVGTIDKEEATLDYSLIVEDGVYFIEFSTQSLGDVSYTYAYNDGEQQALNQAKMPLWQDGKYSFCLTNMLGETAEVNLEYASVLDGDGAIGATVSGSDYVFTLADGLQNVRLLRIDGKGGDVALENNAATLETGTYAMLAEDTDGTLYVTVFSAEPVSLTDPVGDKGTGCNSTLEGAGIALGAVVLFAAGTLAIVWRKKHD